MSRVCFLSYATWHCQYHLVWVPKYRFRILEGVVKYQIHNRMQISCGRMGCEVAELKIELDDVH